MARGGGPRWLQGSLRAGVTEPWSTAETGPGWQGGRVQQLPGRGRWAEGGGLRGHRCGGLACSRERGPAARFPHVLRAHISGSQHHERPQGHRPGLGSGEGVFSEMQETRATREQSGHPDQSVSAFQTAVGGWEHGPQAGGTCSAAHRRAQGPGGRVPPGGRVRWAPESSATAPAPRTQKLPRDSAHAARPTVSAAPCRLRRLRLASSRTLCACLRRLSSQPPKPGNGPDPLARASELWLPRRGRQAPRRPRAARRLGAASRWGQRWRGADRPGDAHEGLEPVPPATAGP